jgi:hypothetical protein
MERKNLLITSLSTSALVLMGILVLIQMFANPQPVIAVGQEKGGDYAVTISRMANGEEALWVLDARNRTVGIYQYDTATRRVELRRVFPIAQAQVAATR